MDLGIGSRVINKEFGVGVVIQSTTQDLVITFVNHGVIEINKAEAEDNLEILEEVESPRDLVSMEQIEETLYSIVSRISDQLERVKIGEKWHGGHIILQPGNPDLKPYELPIDNFFHKIVLVRDRLRVMEQRINSSNLSNDEKVNLQQYITRIYGSLTSFNVLFKEREDGFMGTGAQ